MLQGLKIRGLTGEFPPAAGYNLTPVADSHLCCGLVGMPAAPAA